MTWEETEQRLRELNEDFKWVHNQGTAREVSENPELQARLKVLRKECVQIHERRIELVRAM